MAAPSPVVPPPSKAPIRLVVIGSTLAVLSMLVGFAGFFAVGFQLQDRLQNGPDLRAPGVHTVALEPGIHWVLVAAIGAGSDPEVKSSDVTITDPRGDSVVRMQIPATDMDFEDGRFRGVTQFDAEVAGDYRVEFRSPNGGPYRGRVVPVFNVGNLAVLAGVGAVLGLMFLVGVVLFIVGLVKMNTARNRQRWAMAGTPYGGMPLAGPPRGPMGPAGPTGPMAPVPPGAAPPGPAGPGGPAPHPHAEGPATPPPTDPWGNPN